MNIESYREFCLALPHVEEGFPFDKDTLVFKVGGKMFALVDVEKFESINLKCDPEKALELRERYQAVGPGYHMNKKHWNTVYANRQLADMELYKLVDHSYALILASLPKALRETIPTS